MTNASEFTGTNPITGFVLRDGITYIPEYRWNSTMTEFSGIALTATATSMAPLNRALNVWATLFRLTNGYQIVVSYDLPADQTCTIAVVNPCSHVPTTYGIDQCLTPRGLFLALSTLSNTAPGSHTDEQWLMPLVEEQIAAHSRL